MNNDRASLPDSRRIDLVAKLHKRRGKVGDSLVGPGGEVKLVDLPPFFALYNTCDHIENSIYSISIFV